MGKIVQANRLRNIQIMSLTQETAYDAGGAVDSLLRVNPGSILVERFEVADDTDLISGKEEATTQELLAKWTELPVGQTNCRPHTLASVAGLALGSVETSLVGTGILKHTFRPVTAHLTLPSIPIEALYKTGLQDKFNGMFTDRFTFQFRRGRNRRVSLEANMFGSGTRAAGTATTTEKSESVLNASKASFWLAATTYGGTLGDDIALATSDLVAGGTDQAADLFSLDWTYENNVDLDFHFEIGGGDGLSATPSRVARTQRLNFILKFDDRTEADRVLNQTLMSAQLMVQGALIDTSPNRYEGVNIVWPTLKYRAAPLTEEGGRMAVAVEATPLEATTFGTVLMGVFNPETVYHA